MPLIDEERLELISRGVKIGQEHSKPSAETYKFIHMAEKKMEIMDFRMVSMGDDIKEIKDAVKKNEERFDTLIEKLDSRYALKTTETAVNRIGWLVVSAVVLALLGLILKK